MPSNPKQNSNSLSELTGLPMSIENLMSSGIITAEAAAAIEMQTPIMVMNHIYLNGGNNNMDFRKIEGSFNHSDLSGNNAIQADEVTQFQSISKNDFDEAWKLLLQDIEAIQDPAVKDQAEYNAEQLKEAFEAKDTNKAKRLIGFLKTSIGTVASLATIAQLFGIGS